MKIKIIAEGSSKWERFIRRWGVSFLLGDEILFDTFGDPGVFLDNLRRFKVDLSRIKHIVLSHDDWDHVSGLWWILPGRENITVYICPEFKQEIKYRIASLKVRIIESEAATRITESVYSTGQLVGESEGRRICEQSLVIKTGEGLSVLCGCAHPGVAQIVRKVREAFHEDVHTLIGGFHLKDNAEEINAGVIKDLKELGVCRIVPMHCTGERAVEMMRRSFGDGFVQVGEGGMI